MPRKRVVRRNSNTLWKTSSRAIKRRRNHSNTIVSDIICDETDHEDIREIHNNNNSPSVTQDKCKIPDLCGKN